MQCCRMHTCLVGVVQVLQHSLGCSWRCLAQRRHVLRAFLQDLTHGLRCMAAQRSARGVMHLKCGGDDSPVRAAHAAPGCARKLAFNVLSSASLLCPCLLSFFASVPSSSVPGGGTTRAPFAAFGMAALRSGRAHWQKAGAGTAAALLAGTGVQRG